jgi:VanZ family protein
VDFIKRLRAFFLRWGPTLVMMVLIYVASSIPSEQMPNAGSWDTLFKKGGHMLGYALLGISIRYGVGETGRRAYLTALVGCLLYALSDEYHQSFTPGRNSSIIDVGVDLIGVGVGLLASAWYFNRFKSTR